ncbi:MAG: PIN domain-containing protein [Vicingaceae bacterium]|nr:PIN domain-containing protein [Vicingaceae bacterium]
MEYNSGHNNPSFVEQYQDLIKQKQTIDFLIVGQDPYPKGANGVAFCKNSHYEFFQDNCCGNLVTTSLGLNEEQIRADYKNPKVMFFDLLLTKGIGFINVSNKLLSKLKVDELEKTILETKSENSEALGKAKNIILLGRGKTRSYFEKYYSEYKYDNVLLHPSKNAKNGNEEEWNNLWTSNYIEKEILNKAKSIINPGVKVIGKIDLSKFDKPKKEIIKGKENIYIIDTNVFVDFPDIISKVDKQYQIVLSAKVIDELDNLKVSAKLTDKQTKNVQTALRNINNSIDTRKIKMETADLSLLPNDFNKRSPDNFILSVALKYTDENPIMLTSDNGLQIKSKGLNLTTIKLKDFLKQK